MNIKQAKEEIENTVRAYLKRDENGNYRIPPVRQRPMLLMGPPGVGKTQIVEQAARECGVALVAYTITHHTRQSAVGLPFIREKTYGGKEFSVTEYTMSEIIASVYDRMEQTGLCEGILFIDEINCVSETLAPTMLQFLQGKTFGNQKVPEGWIIVAAGNPPEYNRSAREFDIVTLDRVRKIDVQPDFSVWKEYAYRQSIHGAILSYLELRGENFYRIETTPDGAAFATARGWEDLSEMMTVCESLELEIGQDLILQYIQNPAVAKDFANYYELYQKYRDDYRVDEILNGQISERAVAMLQHARFDERLSVIGLLLSRLNSAFRDAELTDRSVEAVFERLGEWKEELKKETVDPEAVLRRLAREAADSLALRRESGRLDRDGETAESRCVRLLENYADELLRMERPGAEEAFETVKKHFGEETARKEEITETASKMLNHAFDFMSVTFGESQEMVIFVTELTVGFYSSGFILENGSEPYDRYNRSLLLGGRRREILKDIDGLST
ncbi:AAA family ATPase [Caproiciproducens sp. NJN-50]|uniref:AAA family ATPase n=1 Tax=Acutalibacteraceae TaxID=3082771 RepID=UPI000FFE0464|nr:MULTISPECIES: AAA family ATPase [Acutalibacteraceae]QAT50895.1 AAA family ATPase [Caproiciproducens sp. NJN-50]